jgi:hypothetical protein
MQSLQSHMWVFKMINQSKWKVDPSNVMPSFNWCNSVDFRFPSSSSHQLEPWVHYREASPSVIELSQHSIGIPFGIPFGTTWKWAKRSAMFANLTTLSQTSHKLYIYHHLKTINETPKYQMSWAMPLSMPSLSLHTMTAAKDERKPWFQAPSPGRKLPAATARISPVAWGIARFKWPLK